MYLYSDIRHAVVVNKKMNNKSFVDRARSPGISVEYCACGQMNITETQMIKFTQLKYVVYRNIENFIRHTRCATLSQPCGGVSYLRVDRM